MGKRDYYDDDNSKPKIVIWILIIIALLALGVIYYVYSDGDNSKLENNLIRGGKDYYASEDALLPDSAGECSITSLEKLITEKQIKNESLFQLCDKKKTYIKVCKLENGTYHFTPFFSCQNMKTNFGEWKKGTENNLIDNKSDVRFTFQAEKYSNQVKEYYPHKSKRITEVKELYITSPDSEYTNKDSGTKASKWYTEETGKSYWNNGEYSSVEPKGYNKRGEEGSPLTYITKEKPAEASYRTIKNVTLYRARQLTKPEVKDYICIDAKYGSQVISTIPCESRSANNYNITGYVNYTCDGKNTVNKNATCEGKLLNDWSTNKCTDTVTTKCETTSGYQYTDKRWKWYTEGTYKKYYPSGAQNSVEEKTYYVSAPIKNAKKDESTTTTAYKFYRLVDGKANEGQWLSINDGYVSEEELIKIFNKNGLEEVESLADIIKEKDVRYSIKLEYRDRR